MGTTVPCLASWARSAVFSWFRVAMTVAGRFKSLAQLCDLACFRVEFGAQRVGRLAVLRLFGCRLSGLLNGGIPVAQDTFRAMQGGVADIHVTPGLAARRMSGFREAEQCRDGTADTYTDESGNELRLGSEGTGGEFVTPPQFSFSAIATRGMPRTLVRGHAKV